VVPAKVATYSVHKGETAMGTDINGTDLNCHNYGRSVREVRQMLKSLSKDLVNWAGLVHDDFPDLDYDDFLNLGLVMYILNSDVSKIITRFSQTQYAHISREYFLPLDKCNIDDGNKILREVGGIFRTKRKHKTLTLEAVSDQIGVHQSHLSRFESGQRKWGIALLKDLAKALDPSLNLASIFGILGITEADYKRIKRGKQR
jgi:hypothetical protein